MIIVSKPHLIVSRGSVVGIVTRLRAGRYGVWIPVGAGDPSLFFFLSKTSRSVLGPTQPHIELESGLFSHLHLVPR
jgi:hypothetical protein